jgi:hypothetical protein
LRRDIDNSDEVAFVERDIADDVSEPMGASVCFTERGFVCVVGGQTPGSVQEKRDVNGINRVSFGGDVTEGNFFAFLQVGEELRKAANAHVFWTVSFQLLFICVRLREIRSERAGVLVLELEKKIGWISKIKS